MIDTFEYKIILSDKTLNDIEDGIPVFQLVNGLDILLLNEEIERDSEDTFIHSIHKVFVIPEPQIQNLRNGSILMLRQGIDLFFFIKKDFS
jgi:hypothetical protein